MKPLIVALGLLLAALAAVGCRTSQGDQPSPAGTPAWFDDVTDRLGLDFAHDAGPVDDKYFMPQIIGSGAALFDCDGDGRLDLYLVHNGGPKGKTNRLYLQRPDGTFRDASAGSGLDVAGFGMGVAVGDVNNDGRPDVLLTEYGAVRLFLNQGGAKFTDVTREAGLNNPAWATSAAMVDYDRDGWLDLVIVNYLSYDPTWPCIISNGQADFCAPKTFPGLTSRLYRNLGGTKGAPAGAARFKDVSLESGVGVKPGRGWVWWPPT